MTDTTTGPFGARTAEIEHFIDLVRNSTPEHAQSLANTRATVPDLERIAVWEAVRDAGRAPKWQATINALYDAMRSTSWYVARRNPLAYIRSTPDYPKPDPELEHVWAIILNAGLALMAWDLVGQYGLTQDHLDALIGPAESVFGPLRPGAVAS
jgi:hypothetical protein